MTEHNAAYATRLVKRTLGFYVVLLTSGAFFAFVGQLTPWGWIWGAMVYLSVLVFALFLLALFWTIAWCFEAV